ncbi:MAG: transglycosylase SLT domain-containing protein, partial [Nanoarchaeota archaeon]|nr:transglycosylase SLT domain-containing protein [Nanoarchaeota archaeon]
GKFLSEVDLEKRLRYGIHSLCEEIRTQRAPLDPAWLVAMVFAESFFNEFAISPALAVGVSQFIAPTGRGYGLRCGETLGPLLAPDAGQEKRYWELNGQRRALPIVQHFTLEQALQGLIESTTKQEKKKAQEQLAYLQQREGLRQEMQGAGSRFMNYLRANMQGRDIFNSGDRYFLVQLDDRLTPHTALPAMVRLMAENLRQCKGNILVATAAYNAGLQSTQDEGPYECYGRIPANRETTLYVSRILVNYSLMKEKM